MSPSRNSLFYSNKTLSADIAEELFWKVYESLSKQYPAFQTTNLNYFGLPPSLQKVHCSRHVSTTIQLPAFNMGWTKHRRREAAVKMHTALNMCSSLFCFVIVKNVRDSDSKIAWEL